MSADFDLKLDHVAYRVKDGVSTRTILSIDDLSIQAGEVLGLRGASGSGKSTFLKIISGIVTPQQGRVAWGDLCLNAQSESARDDWRGKNCGFLFQDFRLFGGLSALENVLLPLTFRGKITPRDRARAEKMLQGYGVPAQTLAAYLSRGEMQRTALARLLMGSPKVIFADEPTASLDEKNARRVMQALVESSEELGATLFVITHDNDLAQTFPLRARMHQGRWQWLESDNGLRSLP